MESMINPKFNVIIITNFQELQITPFLGLRSIGWMHLSLVFSRSNTLE